jgi:hypothetical protein
VRATSGVGLMAGILALTGCVYGLHSADMGPRYAVERRPDPTYYCYDCHGYRYFDPYYDWCTENGFRYRWDAHPRAVAVYRQRYLRIRRANRDYGRYTYPEDYRFRPRYRDPKDYEEWRTEEARGDKDTGRTRTYRKSRERDRDESGRKREKRPDGAPRDAWLPGTLEGVQP